MNTVKLKLLVDAHGFDDHFQGSRTYLSGLYRSLIKMAPFIHFFFAANNTQLLEKEFGTHPNVSYVKFRKRSNLYRLLIDAPRLIRSYKIDVAHFQYAVPFIKTSKEILTIHDVLFIDFPQYFPLLYRIIRTPIFKRSARRADLLLTVSKYAQQTIAKNFNIAPQSIHVIPNGIDQSFYFNNNVHTSANVSKPFPYLLYVSRIEPRKNHALLLQVYKELGLSAKGYKMIFIGKKDIEAHAFNAYWEQLSEREKNDIIILDSVTQEELTDYYRKASLFIYPSLAEGFGIPPIEAAGSGIPVLCSDATAMSDFTFFGDRLFNPENKEELKQKIEKILSEKDQQFTSSVRDQVLQQYHWDKIAEDFLKLLQTHFVPG